MTTPTPPQPPQKPKREAFVLIVDDDAGIRDMLLTRLDLAGYNVTTAPDAWQGVVQARGLKVGLVITDIQMPGPGNGIEGFKQLRAASPSLPVIFITGMRPEEAKAIIPPDPRVRLVLKPIDFPALRATIKDLTGVDREI